MKQKKSVQLYWWRDKLPCAYPHWSGHELGVIWSPVWECRRSASEEEAARGTTPLSHDMWLCEDQFDSMQTAFDQNIEGKLVPMALVSY